MMFFLTQKVASFYYLLRIYKDIKIKATLNTTLDMQMQYVFCLPLKSVKFTEILKLNQIPFKIVINII